MSNSETFSISQKKHQSSIFSNNPTAIKGQKNIHTARDNLIKRLRQVYHYEKGYDIDFKLETNIKQPVIAKATRDYYGKDHCYFENVTTNIRPDGGIIFYELNLGNGFFNKKSGILVTSEYKKQGDGKHGHMKGNVVERAAKNFNVLKLLQKTDPYFLYFIFCHGKDFYEGSNMKDRLLSFNLYRPFNTIYIDKIKGDESASIFMREEVYTDKEMEDIMFEGCSQVLDNYILKDFDKDNLQYNELKPALTK